MTTRIPNLLFLSAMLLLSAAHGYCADDSLFDPRTARRLNPNEVSFFGPLSGKFRYDSTMVHAAQIAEARAHAHSTSRCWRYVKDALIAANAIGTRPKTEFAKEAGGDLQNNYGFKRLSVSDPYKAPLGSVLVYGGRGAGHVEIRTPEGFVSDFTSLKPSPRPLLGIYVKPRDS